MEKSQLENWNNPRRCKVSFWTGPYCEILDIDQGMKQTKLYLCYPLFKVQGLDKVNIVTKIGIISEMILSIYMYSEK